MRARPFRWVVSNSADAEVMQAALDAHDFGAHFHETWSVGRIDEGECRFRVGDESFVAREGEIVVIPPYAVHTGGNRTRGLRYRMAYVGERWFRDLSRKVLGDAAVAFPGVVIRDAGLSAQLDRALASRDGLGQALARLIARHGRGRHPARRRLQADGDADARSVLKALDCGPASRSTKIRRFAREFGLPPARYLRNLRCVSAKELIRQGLGLAEVALQLGFSDQAHFTREFKRVHGIAPGQYQRSVLGTQKTNRFATTMVPARK